MKTQPETLAVIKKITDLCKADPTFEEKFMIFFERKIVEYQSKEITPGDLDRALYLFLRDYLPKKRERKINSILGKKEWYFDFSEKSFIIIPYSFGFDFIDDFITIGVVVCPWKMTFV